MYVTIMPKIFIPYPSAWNGRFSSHLHLPWLVSAPPSTSTADP